MVVGTLALSGAVKLVGCASFLVVGRALRSRGTTTAYTRTASRAFVAWWWGMAGFMAIQGAIEIGASLGLASLVEMRIARLVQIPMIAAAAWGIMTYVLMLLWGVPRAPRVVGAYAVVSALAYVAQTLLQGQTLSVGAWGVGMEPVGSRTLFTLVYALFGVPLLLATLMYASLLFRVREPLQRYRVALVSGSLLAWVGGGLLGSTSGNDVANFVGITVLGLVTALAVLLAYRPPASVLARLSPSDPAVQEHLREARARRESRHQRYLDLI